MILLEENAISFQTVAMMQWSTCWRLLCLHNNFAYFLDLYKEAVGIINPKYKGFLCASY